MSNYYRSLIQAGVAFDPDALAFITAAGLTDDTQKNAINTLVLDLKSNNVWSKMKALYPFVGGTATTHKWNLKDPRDLNVAYRLVFFGGVTHDNNGVTGNAINGCANTFFTNSIDSNGLLDNSAGVYSRTDSNSSGTDKVEFGSINVGVTVNAIELRYANISYGWTNTTINQNFADTNSLGLYQIGVNGSGAGNQVFYKNGVAKVTGNFAGGTLSTTESALLARREGAGFSLFSNRNLAFAFIGDGLDASESLAMYNINQNFQTILSRQV